MVVVRIESRLREGGTAIIDRDATSYAELADRSSRLAALLQQRGVGADRAVAVVADRGAAQITALLAVLRAGGVYVPIKPDLPAQRISWMISDAAPIAIVCDGPPPAALAGLDVIRIDLPLPAATFEAVEVSPEALAYIVYTSGSTGRPKGVMVTRRALDTQITWTQTAFELGARDRMLQLAASVFDYSIVEMLAPLAAGGTVIVPSDLDPMALAALADRHGATIVHFVPSLFRVVLDACKARPWLGVRTVLCGGEAVTLDLVRNCRTVFPNAKLYNQYGPTETGVIATYWLTDPAAERVAIGHAVTGVTTHIVDGELWLGGDKLARGYLHRPDLTAERFVPDPFVPGARVYRTGDQVREGRDGLEFLGRADFQVKIRGVRIELGEIEAQLALHPGVREAVVLAREDEPGDKRLVAYIVAASEKEPQLWPSIGEYDVYDALIYAGLTNDHIRHDKYRRALAQVVPGKIVVDIGTGADAVLARMCAELGAKRVYAIEILEASYRSAVARVAKAGLSDRIVVLHGDARTLALPELADICVSEIVEAIGGAEGAAKIIGDARRLWRADGIVIPERSVTRIAAAMLPERLERDPAFTPVSAHYVEQIFARTGGPFDLRLCIKDFPADHLLSNHGVMEDLDYARGCELGYRTKTSLAIHKLGTMTGLLAWLRLHIGAGEILDILEEETAWFPIYMPTFDPGVEVRPGDVIELECSASASDNGFNPDYFIEGTLVRDQRVVAQFRHASVHHDRRVRGGPYYRRLFAGDRIPSRAPASVSAAALRETLRASLPEYMIPSAFVRLDALPLTTNGKLDRNALPAPVVAARAIVAPRDAAEQLLANIWRDVLGISELGIADNFFELGGHSLLAIRVASRAREAFGVAVTQADLFAAPTIALLAERVRGADRAIQITPSADRSQLSLVQQRLWFLDQLDPANRAYNLPSAYRLRGLLDCGALARAFGALVERHEVLRTVFPAVGGVPRAEVQAARAFDLPVEDATEATAARRAEQAMLEPFDLARGPLIRARLIRISPTDHVLLIDLHHIVFDGWSTGVMWRELAALYRGETLPVLTLQYADYAAWSRSRAVDEDQLAAWTRELADAPADLALPYKAPRPPARPFRAGRIDLVLEPALSATIHRLATRSGTTSFVVILAALRALIARYTGEPDVCIGTAVADRGHAGVEDLVGFFVNTLVLRGRVERGDRFVDVLARETEHTRTAYARQDVPFERIVDALGAPRAVNRMPLLQVMCIDHGDVSRDGALPGVTTEPFRLELDLADVDLIVVTREREGRRELAFTYAEALFDRDVIDALAHSYVKLLEAAVAAPEQSVGDVLATTVSRGPIVAFEPPVHRAFERQARATPDALALVAGERTLTYGELNTRANQLARALRARGVGPESLVAVVLPRGIDPVVAFVAVWKAGGAYVPIDPDAPADRIASILADARPAVVITQLDDASHFEITDLALAIDPQTLAYVIYTSGSTGRPKGILVPHAGVANYARDVVERWDLRAGDRVLGFAPFTFDSSIADLTGTLTSGATLYIRPPEIRGGAELARLLAHTKATHALLPPVVWSSLPDVALPSLRVAITAGDACGDDVIERWARGRTLINEYGPTEITVCASSSTLALGASPTIGRAISNAATYVLDDAGVVAPLGARGELFVGGAGVTRGYLGNAALTAERFVPDPYGPPGTRMYRTGDVAYLRPDGQLAFLGRSDHQVKVRGYRIELGEIEAALLAHPDVTGAAAIVRGAAASKALVAYVVLARPTEIAELRGFLGQRLPEYMVPAAIVALAEFPLTRNGKLDRNALPAPSDEAFARSAYEPPRTRDEQALAEVWRVVLGVERVGIRDNFFALGGHSLLAVQLVARIHEQLGAELALSDLFATPTIEELAARLRRVEKRDPVKRLKRTEGVAGLLQPYWWTVQENDPNKGRPLPLGRRRRGILPELWHLRGPIDPAALERAVMELGTRHEILRTNYRRDERGLRQVVRPAKPPYLPMFTYSDHELDLHELATRPFDLSDGPLMRFDLMRLDSDHHALMMQLHHVVADGPSNAIIRRELAAGYRGEPLAAMPLQFLDIAEYLDGYRATAAGLADLEYWRHLGDGIEPLELPVDFPRAEVDAEISARRAATGRQFIAYFPTEVARASDPLLAALVTEAARRENVTLLVVALAAMAALLHGETGQTEISLQTSLNIRPLLGAEPLIGGFNSVIVLRLDFARMSSHRDLLRATRDAFAQAYAHALISPLDLVPASAGRVNLGLWGAVGPGPTFQLGEAVEVPAPSSEVEFDLAFDLAPGVALDGDRLSIAIAYNTKLFRRSTVERLSVGYLEVLRAIARDPAAPLR